MNWWFLEPGGRDLDLDLNGSLIFVQGEWGTTPEPPNHQAKQPIRGKLIFRSYRRSRPSGVLTLHVTYF